MEAVVDYLTFLRHVNRLYARFKSGVYSRDSLEVWFEHYLERVKYSDYVRAMKHCQELLDSLD